MNGKPFSQRLAVIVVSVAWLCACATKPEVIDITDTLTSTEETKIEGIPFRLATEHKVTI